jgi:hypothetical protein
MNLDKNARNKQFQNKNVDLNIRFFYILGICLPLVTKSSRNLKLIYYIVKLCFD